MLDQATTTAITTGLVAGTRVMTGDGALPVEHLVPGDRIVTRNGLRTLVSIDLQQRRNVDIVRIAASALGHGRPGAEITLGADQTLLIRGWRARAMFGAEEAKVPANRLADGEYIVRETAATATIFTLGFDAPQTIYAEGCELAVEDPATALV